MNTALESLFSSLNVLGGRREREGAVAEFFTRQHRTLQQQFVAVVILPVLRSLADSYEQGRCDGRNMAAARLASRMLRDLTDDDLYLPLI